jgi:hypothetical protein
MIASVINNPPAEVSTVDTSAGGLLVTEAIIFPVVNTSVLI